MSSTQIAKFVSAVKNSQRVQKGSLFWPCTKSILEIVRILKTEGYISHFKFSDVDKKKYVEVILKNYDSSKIRNSFTLVSRPSLLKYFSKKDVWKFSTKVGILILSTPLGILSDREARMLRTGGKALLYVC